ncbi:MAG: gluconolaconase [Cyanobacteria bacterium RYN_339]|nr:gluconolaconase [Cyanobacteria bacterium RYN_339]
MRVPHLALLLACAAALGGCPGTPTTAAGKGKASPAPIVAGFHTGRVVDVAGSPVAGLLVRGYIISDVGGGLTGLVRVPIVSTSGSGVVGNNGAAYHVAADDGPVSATTGADGTFTLKAPVGSHLNLEAAKSDELKAFQPDVAPEAHDLTLQLAPTGAIAGVVKASTAGVTKLLGVDVFIPGSSYVAKTAEDGHYTLDHVPVGLFPLVASKAGLGQAIVKDVKVASKQTTAAPDLILTVVPPAIAAVTPANGPVGTTVTLTGEHFGADAGDLLDVKFAGTSAIKPERVDEHTIKVKVPEGAATGGLVVTVAGIPSNDIRFPVVKRIDLPSDRPGQPLDLALHGSRTLLPTVLDTDGKAVDKPALTWTAEGAVSVDATGKITGMTEGSGTVTVHAGSLDATSPVKVAGLLAGIQAFGAIPDRQGVDSLSGPAIDAEGGVWALLVHVQFGSPANSYSKLFHLAPGGAAPVADGPALDGLSNQVGTDGQGHILVASGNKLLRFGADGKAVELPGSGSVLLNEPRAITGDAVGNVYVVASHPPVGSKFKPDLVLCKVDATGAVTALAGGEQGYMDGKGTAARFYSPVAIAADAAGLVYMIDQTSVRRIAADGSVSLVAGVPLEASVNGPGLFLPPFSPLGSKDGTGAAASFTNPNGLVVEPATGQLLVADRGWLRRIVPGTGVVTTWLGSDAPPAEPTAAETFVGLASVGAFKFGVALAKDGTLWTYQDGPVRVRLGAGL